MIAMSGIATANDRPGRTPSASMMFSLLRIMEEAADMTALEYYERLNKERRTIHKLKDKSGEVVEFKKGNATFRCTQRRLPLSALTVVESPDENLLAKDTTSRPHRYRI